MSKQKKLLSLLICILILLICFNPQVSIDACLKGILVWATAILPTLLPFFFLTRLLIELNLIEKVSRVFAPITTKLFNTGGISSYVYVMSIMSGYPVGAKLTADLYQKQAITQGQAQRICTFTSTSGPLFIISTVGIGMYSSQRIGIIILIAHLLGAFVNGLLYRKHNLDQSKPNNNYYTNNKVSTNILEECMLSSITSVLIVGGYVAIFFTIITIINTSGFNHIINSISNYLEIINLNPKILTSIFNGSIEMTRGCLDLQNIAISTTTLTILATGLISFGGICIMCQAMTYLQKIGITYRFYLKYKLTQCLISMAIAYILLLI